MTFGRLAAGASAALLLVVILLSAAAAAVVESLTSPLDVFSTSRGAGAGASRIPDADGEIPLRMYELYHRAATTCSGLPWTVLAGFGKVASDHGRHVTDKGVMGLTAGQFARYADPIPAGGASPATDLDPVDAVFATARSVCGSGLVTDLSAAVGRAASDPGVAVRVVELADVYGHAPSSDSFIAAAARTAPNAAARLALEYAGAQMGLPYVWGGDGPDRGGSGFDCSGLTQTAFQAAGIAIPRTATEQFKTGRPVAKANLRAGDLVFYGNPNGFLHHVAIYVARGLVIDAPHTGAVVRLDPVAAGDYAGARRES